MAIFKKIINSLKKIFHSSRGLRPRRKSKTLSRKKIRSKIKRKAKPRKRKLGKVKAPARPLVKEVVVGEVTHFFPKIVVCVVKIIRGQIKIGDRIHIKGGSTDFQQTVRSLQIESVDVKAGRRGQVVGLKVERAARVGDKVYKAG